MAVITGYSFDAAQKQITVTQEGYTDISPEMIVSIFNANTGTWLYNPNILKYGAAPTSLNKYHPLQSVTGGVITYTAPNAQGTTNDDTLIITIASNIVDGGTP